MRVRIRGQIWNILFGRNIRFKGQECYGLCDRIQRRICLEPAMPPKRLMRIALHEGGHACNWDHDEDAIKRDAAVLTEVLWKLGFRLVKPPRGYKWSK